MRNHYLLGRLPVSLEGDSPFADALAAELAPILDPAASPPEAKVRIRVVERLTPFAETVAMAPITVAPDGLAHVAGKCRYQVRREAGGLGVDVCVPRAGIREIAPEGLQRFSHFNYLSHAERRVKSFVYDIFDYVTQSEQVLLGQSFVHASALERDGEAVALLAWGGIGKTTSMLKLVLEDGWRFLSDDLGIVDADGTLHRSPKHMQIYGYNLAGQPKLTEAFFGGRSTADRISWRIYKLFKGDQRIRRRVSAEELFGPARVARNGKLSKAIFLERHSGRDFRHTQLSAEALAERCTAILLREIDPFALVTNAVHGGGNSVTIPTLGEMDRASHAIMRAAFDRVPCHVVGIPRGAGPDALVAYLRPLIG